jgi:hypothetical protein
VEAEPSEELGQDRREAEMTGPLQAKSRPRVPRWDKGHPWWTPRDLAVLLWIAEQYGVRRDHLALLLGREAQAETRTPGRLGVTTVNDWVQRWRRAGVLESTHVLAGQPSWVWLTRAGLDHLELDYRLWEPKARGVEHLHAVNEARLWVEARELEAEWRSERSLRSGQPFVAGQTRAEHQPDAEVELRGQRVAIEVERSSKSKKRQPAILYQLARRYDAIWYFCAPATQRLMERALADLNPPAIRAKFSLVALLEDEERNRRANGTPHPPPPAKG